MSGWRFERGRELIQGGFPRLELRGLDEIFEFTAEDIPTTIGLG